MILNCIHASSFLILVIIPSPIWKGRSTYVSNEPAKARNQLENVGSVMSQKKHEINWKSVGRDKCVLPPM